MSKKPAPKKKFVGDDFNNFAAKLGYGQNNLLSASNYDFTYITRNRTMLEAAYRTSWIVGIAVDCVAEDMTRAGIDMESTLEPDKIDRLTKAMTRLQIWQNLCNAFKWARLFGGAGAVILIDGQKPETPLRMDTIGKGAFKGLLVLDRWMVNPSLNDLVTELGPHLGMPKYYNVIGDSNGLASQKIHYTRFLRFDGIELPYWQKKSENLWGMSIIERLWDRLIAFDSGTMGAAQMLFKAHLRTISIEGLREIIAAGGPALEGMTKQIEMIRLYQSNEGITLLDATDKFEAHQYTFTGITDVMLQLAQQVSGALQIPMVRFYGQSPAGLNSTGESDLRTYYDGINKMQNNKLRNPLHIIMECLSRSELSADLPDDFHFEFSSLWQLTETEKATIASTDSNSIVNAFNAGIFERATALRELRQSSRVSGRFSNITDEEINEADAEPPRSELIDNEEENDLPGEEGDKDNEDKNA